NGVKLVATIAAQSVGHAVPTGFIDRHLILVVEGFDKQGKPLRAQAGPTLPDAAGKSLAGFSGDLFGRLMVSSKGDLVPFWLAKESPKDPRLHRGKPIERTWTFAATLSEARVRLIYRRSWEDVARAKRWPDNEIVIIDRRIGVS